mmetsp:Transcript_10991/g.42518  ORF Transcript_10991/g.42518 Transcript_10991/m.42518 type:complete len:390 (-) Transcript_10991:172-1341(-)
MRVCLMLVWAGPGRAGADGRGASRATWRVQRTRPCAVPLQICCDFGLRASARRAAMRSPLAQSHGQRGEAGGRVVEVHLAAERLVARLLAGRDLGVDGLAEDLVRDVRGEHGGALGELVELVSEAGVEATSAGVVGEDGEHHVLHALLVGHELQGAHEVRAEALAASAGLALELEHVQHGSSALEHEAEVHVGKQLALGVRHNAVRVEVRVDARRCGLAGGVAVGAIGARGGGGGGGRLGLLCRSLGSLGLNSPGLGAANQVAGVRVLQLLALLAVGPAPAGSNVLGLHVAPHEVQRPVLRLLLHGIRAAELDVNVQAVLLKVVEGLHAGEHVLGNRRAVDRGHLGLLDQSEARNLGLGLCAARNLLGRQLLLLPLARAGLQGHALGGR